MKKIILGLALSGLLGTSAAAHEGSHAVEINADAAAVVEVLLSPSVSHCLVSYQMAVADVDESTITVELMESGDSEYRFTAISGDFHNAAYSNVTMVVNESTFTDMTGVEHTKRTCRVMLPQD